ncbi:MAG: hypothetical protein KC503_12815, partial [Myxococcales bacterium]|nr:hypothetical protein [Myxococcales bacterium]
MSRRTLASVALLFLSIASAAAEAKKPAASRPAAAASQREAIRASAIAPALQRLAHPRVADAARAKIVAALGATRARLVLGVLRRIAREDRARSVRLAAIDALAKLGGSAAAKTLGQLARSALYPSSADRAVIRLRTIHAPAAARELGALARLSWLPPSRRKLALQSLTALTMTALRGARTAARGPRPCSDCGKGSWVVVLSELLGGSAPQRTAAVETLRRVYSKRALEPLRYAASDPAAPVRAAAMSALGKRRSSQPTSQPAVVVASQPTSQRAALVASQPTSQRAAIVESQPTSQPAAVVESKPTSQPAVVVESKPAPPTPKTPASQPALAARVPALPETPTTRSPALSDTAPPVDDTPTPAGPDRRGYVPLMLGAAASGSLALYAITAGAGGDNAWTSALAGAALGGGTPALILWSNKKRITLGGAAAFATLTGWSTLGGLQAGLSAKLDRALAWPVVGGDVLGALAGALALRGVLWSRRDLGFINLSAAQGALAGLGLSALVHGAIDIDTTSERLGVALGAGLPALLSLGAASVGARRVKISARDVGLTAYSTLTGGAVGALLVPAGAANAKPDLLRIAGGVALGQSLGYGLGIAAAQGSELSADRQGVLWLDSATLGVAGAGLGLLVRGAGPRVPFALSSAGVALGAGAGALLSRPLSLRARDLGGSLFGSGYGAWLGAWLPAMIYSAPAASQRGGGAMLGTGLGLLAGNVTSRLVDASPRGLGYAGFGAAAGAAAGAGVGMLVPAVTSRGEVSLMNGASLAAMLTGGILAHRLRLSPADIGLAQVGALYGAATLGLLPRARQSGDASAREQLGGVLAGAGLGALVTAGVAQAVELAGMDVLELSVFTASGFGFGGGLALLARAGTQHSALLLQGVGSTGLALGALLAPRLRYSERDALLVATLSAGAAFNGALLADTWRSADVRASERAGGALAGATLGLLAGALISQPSEMPYGDSGEMALSLVAGDMLGAGIGLLANTSRPNTLRLMQGVGLATWIGGGLRAPHTRYSARDVLLTAQLVAGGAANGALLADTWLADRTPSGSERGGGAMLGAALGLVAGSFVSQHSEMHYADSGEMALSLVA